MALNQTDGSSLDLYQLPDDRLLNNGSVQDATEWFWDDIKLPVLKKGSRVGLEGEFDPQNGALNFDNILFHTRQKYVNK